MKASSNNAYTASGAMRPACVYATVPIASGGGGERSGEGQTDTPQAEGQPGVAVSPNPFTSSVSFEFGGVTNDGVYSIEATGLSGRQVWKSETSGDGRVLWNASGLPAGVYFYRIRSGLGDEIAHGKVVKVNK